MNPFTTVEDLIIDPSFRRWILHQDPEARAQWQAYLAAHPGKKALIEKARLFLEELPKVNYQMPPQEKDLLWGQIAQKADTQSPVIYPVTQKTRKLQWYYAAASVAVLIAFIILWNTKPQNFTTAYQTNYGETKEIILPDGSLVTLNANSSLRFDSQSFTEKKRKVWMQGEAYFEIVRRTTADETPLKFLVYTDDLEVEVLGTQFNVNTRRTATKVVLTEGKVRLNLAKIEKGPSVNMVPGEMVTYTPTQQSVKKENVNLNIYTAWKQQELVFEDTPVREIIELLEDNYGLKIRLENQKAAQRHYTGTFKNPDPEIILIALTALFELEKEQHNDLIILK